MRHNDRFQSDARPDSIPCILFLHKYSVYESGIQTADSAVKGLLPPAPHIPFTPHTAELVWRKEAPSYMGM